METEPGSKAETGYSVQIQERDTRKTQWEQLEDDFAYDPNQLDHDMMTLNNRQPHGVCGQKMEVPTP